MPRQIAQDRLRRSFELGAIALALTLWAFASREVLSDAALGLVGDLSAPHSESR